MVEGVPKNQCCLSFQKILQDQQVGLTQAPFKLFLLPWVPEHMRFCMFPLRVEFLFHTGTPLGLPRQAPLHFKVKCSGSLSSWHRTHRLASLKWSSDPSVLGENLCNCSPSPFHGSPTRMVLDYIISPPILSHHGFFFMSLIVKDLFW